MNETFAGRGSHSAMGLAARRSVATSLFGGAILATVATASLAQSTYFPTAALLSTGTASGYVVLGGNLTAVPELICLTQRVQSRWPLRKRRACP